LAFPELAESEIALHDIKPERLGTAELLAQRVAETLGVRPKVTASLDRREALEGAGYVINSIQVGGHAATVRDQEIPARYGLRQTIADTLGIGGIIRTLRTAPVMLGIGNDMAEVCPGAWLLNYTNPMAMMCQLVYQGTPQQNVVGLCHSVQGTMEMIAGLCEVPVEEVTYFGAGINHQTFLYRLEHGGESLYPKLDEAIARNPDLLRRVRVDMYRRLGYFPTESSEHSAEYSPWYMRHDSQIERFRIPVGDYIGRSAEGLEEYERVKAEIASGRPLAIERSWEYASVIINSIETGEPSVIYGNVRNTGLITNLPADICVEVPCLVDRTGVQPTHVGEVAPQCAALNRTFSNVCDLTVRAVLEGRRDHVRHAAMLDPNTAATLTLDQIDALVEELLEAYADLLPESLR
ncbi:MAG: alpha-galactosidase, partial [Gaiellales bacterium]|nr:alpha-galactosidase [Gaiellales bacterium]